jgi:UDP-N-acetylglucosamine 1-carboxyvinyltransferase
MIQLVLSAGERWETRDCDVFVPRGQSLTIVPDLGDAIPRLTTRPGPASRDLMSIAIIARPRLPALYLSEKDVRERLYFVDKLIGMSARIVLCDPHRCVVQGFLAAREPQGISSPDSARAWRSHRRAGRAGQSVIRNIGQIDRGYERVDEKSAPWAARSSASRLISSRRTASGRAGGRACLARG